MIGKSIAQLYGKFDPGEAITIYAWRGQLVGRRLAKVIRMPLTAKRSRVTEAATLATRALNDLDIKGRSEWGAQSTKYCASLREKHNTAKFPWYMRRHSQEPPGWAAYFLFCNLLAYHSGFSFPRMKAPLSGANPPSPHVRWVKLSDDRKKVYGEIEVHPLKIYDKDFALRIWLAGQYIMHIPQSIHKTVQLGPGPSPDQTKFIVVPFEFETIRCAGFRFNQENLRFDDMAYGSIYIYADCVTAYSNEHGPHVSAYSNVQEVLIPNHGHWTGGGRSNKPKRYIYYPGMKLSKDALKLLRRLQEYMKKQRKKLKPTIVIQKKPKWEK